MQPCKFSAYTKESEYSDLVWKWRKFNSKSLQLLLKYKRTDFARLSKANLRIILKINIFKSSTDLL